MLGTAGRVPAAPGLLANGRRVGSQESCVARAEVLGPTLRSRVRNDVAKMLRTHRAYFLKKQLTTSDTKEAEAYKLPMV